MPQSFVFLLFLLSKVAQKKKKQNENAPPTTTFPAAHLPVCLLAAGARKGGFLKKAPFKSPKNFYTAHAKLSASAPKVRRQLESRTAGAPAAGGVPN